MKQDRQKAEQEIDTKHSKNKNYIPGSRRQNFRYYKNIFKK